MKTWGFINKKFHHFLFNSGTLMLADDNVMHP